MASDKIVTKKSTIKFQSERKCRTPETPHMDYHPDDARMLVMPLIRCHHGLRLFYKVQGLNRRVDCYSPSLMKCVTSYFHIVDTS